jgi:hypothetical protein
MQQNLAIAAQDSAEERKLFGSGGILTRIETSAILKQLGRSRDPVGMIHGKRLNKKEAAVHILDSVKGLYLAADASGIPVLTKLLEYTFYEAFLVAGGKVSEAAAALLAKDR